MGLGQCLGDLEYEILTDIFIFTQQLFPVYLCTRPTSWPWENREDYSRQDLCFHCTCMFERKRQLTNKQLWQKTGSDKCYDEHNTR